MVIALDPRPDTGSWEYVTKEDRKLPEDQQTVWTLRGLTVSEWARAADMIASSGGGAFTMGQAIARFGIVAVRNFRGADGEEIPLTRDVFGAVTEEFLQRVILAVLLELGTEIQTRTTLSKADVEKLAPSLEG